jgi:23S rRNA (uridine2552-2'-O)-methyltransferase
MAKNRFSKAWMHAHLNDPYVKLAQQRRYRSRAAFKLLEIDEQDRLIRPGQTVVDLGSAPGSWSQVVREKLAGPGGTVNGRIVAIDLLPMEPVDGVAFLQGDFRDEAVLERLEALLEGRKVDLVLSDMAPNLSGVGLADAARMGHLAELALEFASRHLKPDGALLVKCFHGSGYSQIVEAFKRAFVSVAVRKPKASRAESAETYLLGRRPKQGAGESTVSPGA